MGNIRLSVSALHGRLIGLVGQQAGLQKTRPSCPYSRKPSAVGTAPPEGPSLFRVLDSLAKVCRHNLHVLHIETLLCVADQDTGEPGLVPPPGHVPGATVPRAAHDQVDSGRTAACWQARLWWASLLHP